MDDSYLIRLLDHVDQKKYYGNEDADELFYLVDYYYKIALQDSMDLVIDITGLDPYSELFNFIDTLTAIYNYRELIDRIHFICDGYGCDYYIDFLKAKLNNDIEKINEFEMEHERVGWFKRVINYILRMLRV